MGSFLKIPIPIPDQSKSRIKGKETVFKFSQLVLMCTSVTTADTGRSRFKVGKAGHLDVLR